MSTERRLTHRLMNYWQQIKGDRPLPMLRDIDQDEIPDMWDYCFLIRVNKSSDFIRQNDFIFTYLGRSLQELAQRDEVHGDGEYLETLPADRLEAIFTEMQMTRVPIVENVDAFETRQGRIMFRQCLCPIAGEDGHVSRIFGGLRYKFLSE